MRWTVAFWLGAATVMTGADSNPIEFFEKRVQPVLAANCYSCHTASKLGGLRLDSRQAMLAGGKSGPAIVPGRSGESLLLQVVDHTHPRLKMPPQGKLSAAEIAGLRQWIDDGAHWPGATATTASKPDLKSHWSFQPIRKPAVPAVRNAAWPITPIDRFVLAKLESEGLAPVGSANRRVLIRRATFDLIGLPPAPADVE
ncbi:MAG: c-type cytochrome domain-containing protein, partial [Bryobacteraceae bacterium]